MFDDKASSISTAGTSSTPIQRLSMEESAVVVAAASASQASAVALQLPNAIWPLAAEGVNEKNLCFKIKKGGAVFFAVVCLSVLPKILVLTADSIGDIATSSTGKTFKDILALEESIRGLALAAGSVGTLSIAPFVVKKGYEFVMKVSALNLILGLIFGVPSVTPIAAGAERAWRELGASPDIAKIGLGLGFTTVGATIFGDTRQQMADRGAQDNRLLQRVLPCLRWSIFCRRPKDLGRENKRLQVNALLDDHVLLMNCFSSEAKLTECLHGLEGLRGQENFSSKFAAYVKAYPHQVSVFQRAVTGISSYLIAPSVSALTVINTYTYSQTFFSELFSFMQVPGVINAVAGAVSAAGTALHFLFAYFATRANMLDPIIRFFSRDLKICSTYVQLIANLFLLLPATAVGTSNLALALDNPSLSPELKYLVGISLVIFVTSITFRGFTEAFSSVNCAKKIGLGSDVTHFNRVLKSMRDYISGLSDADFDGLYDALVTQGLLKQAPVASPVSDERAPLIPA